MTALADAVRRAGPQDSVYFFFAGHGLANEQAFYLCCTDANKDRLEGTALSSNDIEQLLEFADCRGVLIVLDCCEGAAFAEHAPAMFRRLRRGEFRILLSSARADQRSWERTGGGGTFFSNALIDIVDGKLTAGTVPGAAYFSDLVSAIEARIVEDLQLLPEHPRQDMVFVGTYIRDPLILVHRNLSLQQVQFATARYSPAYLRRLLLRSFAVVVGLAFFILTTAYGLLRATQYLRDEGERFVVYQGHPQFNLPGFPRQLWSLSYGAERLNGFESARGQAIVAPIGEPVFPLVEAHLRPDMRLLDMLDSGRSSEARTLSLVLINDAGLPFEQRLNAHLAFAMLARTEDTELLRTWLKHGRTEVRLAALRALMRVAPNVGFDAAEKLVDFKDSDVHVEVLKSLAGECRPEVLSYLANRFDSRGSHPTNEQIFDAAVRIKCRLGVSSLVKSAERPQVYGDRNAASYAELMNLVPSFSAALVARLRQRPVDILRNGTFIGTLAELSEAPCIREYRDGLFVRMLDDRVLAAAALARHCPHMAVSLSWDPEAQTVTVKALQQGQTIWSQTLSIRDRQARSALVLLTRLPDLHLPVDGLRDTARALLEVDGDDYLRTALVQVLMRLGDRAALPADLVDSNNLELRSSVVEYMRAQGERELVKQLLVRLGGRDAFYVGLLGRISLDNGTLHSLSPLLQGTVEERRQAACVIAMQADETTVMKLLLDLDSRIRGEAADCVPFNRNARSIAAALPKSWEGFPIGGYRFVLEQVAIRDEIEQQLAETPPSLREWRLSIVDATPGGFGRLGRGLRFWLDEQKFLQRLAWAR